MTQYSLTKCANFQCKIRLDHMGVDGKLLPSATFPQWFLEELQERRCKLSFCQYSWCFQDRSCCKCYVVLCVFVLFAVSLQEASRSLQMQHSAQHLLFLCIRHRITHPDQTLLFQSSNFRAEFDQDEFLWLRGEPSCELPERSPELVLPHSGLFLEKKNVGEKYIYSNSN